MTRSEYQNKVKELIQSNLNKFDKFEKFDMLWNKLQQEDWFKLELENAVLKEIDKFVDVRDISIGDKNYFISNNTE